MRNKLPSPDDDDTLERDPIFTDGLREGGWILVMWFSCFVWTMVVCLTWGYQEDVDPRTFATVFGIPAWVAWGIAFPWLIANVVTLWFCAFCMKDRDLGEDQSEADANGESPE